MKKSLKRTCAIALALAATAGVTGVENVAVNNNNVQNNNVVFAENAQTQPGVLSISNYEKKVTLGDWFKMPTAFYETSSNVVDTYVVTAPSGKTITPTQPEGKELGFTVNEIGTYKITYTIDNGTIKYTGEVTFESSVSTYSISLETNNNRVLPKKVGTNDSAENFYVPSYIVKDKNGEKVTNVTPVITVKTPNVNEAPVTVDAATGKVNFAENYKFVKGTYIVDYYIYNEDGLFLTKTSAEFACVEGDAYKSDAELVVSFSNETPESVNIGKTISLPSVTAKVDGEEVPVYYTVKVFKNGEATEIDANETVGNTDTKVLENVDGVYKFTAKEIVNYYTVKYTIYSAGGKITKEHEFEIDTVEDSLNPTPIVVDYYDTATVTNPKDVSYKLRTNFTDKNITILPIYAEDLGSFKFSDYKTLKREIQNSSYEVIYTDEANPNKTIVFNYDATIENEFTKEGQFIVAEKDEEAIKLSDGTYYVKYTAVDASGNSETETFKFVVDADFETNDAKPVKAPTVEFNDQFFENVEKGEEITFGKPTFSDDKDARLETKVYYQYFKDETPITAEGKQETEVGDGIVSLELNDNNKYVIDTSKAPVASADTWAATSVKIYAYAKNDSGKETIVVKEIKINSPVSGEKAPTVEQVLTDGTDNAVSVKVGTEIKIPSVIFKDLDDVKALDASITITYEDEDNKVVNQEAQNGYGIRSESAKTYTYAGASFTPGVKGKYTVAIKATDAEGNVTVQFIQYNVEEIDGVGAIRFTDIGLSDTTLELGETLKLPKAEVSYPEKESEPNKYTYLVRKKSGPNGEGEKLNKDRFAPTKVGEYVIEYILCDSNGAPIKDGDEYLETYEFKVTVEDKTNPEIYVDWRTTVVDDPEVENSLTAEEGKEVIVKDAPVQIQSTYKVKTKILLPYFSAKDLSGIDTSKSMITITNKATSSTRTIKFDAMKDEYAQDGDLFYEFKKDGEYTITYTAYDLQGNSSKQSFTIKIGDLDDPELTVSDDVLKSKYNVGDEITIDLTDDSKEWFTIVDADTTLKKEDIEIKLTVDGVEVENQETDKGKYRFKIDKAGSYNLTFTVEDAAGNETVVNKDFTVAEKGASSVNGTEVTGIILIVVSVVVLGGVIVYFVISKRKMDKLYK